MEPISTNRYMMNSNTVVDVHTFSSELIRDHVCVPRLTAKMKTAPVRSLSKLLKSATSMHVDIFGLIKPLSLGGNRFAIHLLENYSHISEVATKIMSDLSSNVNWFISKANDRYASEGESVAYLRADNTNVKFASYVADFCTDTEIDTKMSSAYALESN